MSEERSKQNILTDTPATPDETLPVPAAKDLQQVGMRKHPMAGKEFHVAYFPIRYQQYIIPRGRLPDVPPCHALWHYFITAMAAYKRMIEDIRIEKTRDTADFHQQFTSTAQVYGVDPNDMEKFWSAVLMQAMDLGLTLPPPIVRNPFQKRVG